MKIQLTHLAPRMLLLVVLLAMIGGRQGPLLAGTTTDPLVQKADLAYQGAFRVPQGTSDTSTFSYGGTAITFNPANNSLFITGHDWHQLSAEIKIPAIVNSTSINRLATASILQSFKDPTEGKLASINPSDPNPKKVGGHFVFNGKLYLTGYSYYDGAVSQSSSHFARPMNLSTTGQVVGPVRVGKKYPGFIAGYMTNIPTEWQTLLGGPVITGWCCVPGASWQSQGPSATVFDPRQIGQVSPVPATPILGYQYPKGLCPGDHTATPNNCGNNTNLVYNLATRITGIVFPVGTRSVLFFGRHGVGTYCYGEGAACGDPADPYKGTHAYPYKYQTWAFDANDLVAVKNGAKQQYEVQPYAIWNFNLPFEDAGGRHEIGGAAYDPQTNQIYISQQCADSDCRPIIHVFKYRPNR